MSKSHFRVLIIDDEYYLGQMLAQALMQEKIEAMALTDVDTAIDSLNKKHYDLIVSDIYLPVKDGRELFRYVKEHNIDIPFIFMTGNPDLEMAVSFLTQGGYDYIVKPFMIPDFIKKVKSVLQSHEKKQKEKNLVKDLRSLLASRLSELKIYQDVFESTDDGVVITDHEWNIVKVNPGFENITSMSSVQLLHQPMDILRKSILPDLDVQKISQELKQENTWHGELVGKTGQNSNWFANITFTPIRNEDAQIFAYAGLFKNVTAQRQVEQALITSLQKMNLAQEAIIFGLARLAEHRDQTTGYHLERIRSYSKVLAEKLMELDEFSAIIDESFIQMLVRTAPLHDIGKVGIPDYILLKNNKLTEPEYETMKSHTTIGYQILNSILKQYGKMEFLNMGIDITYSHHEKWDGTGYPRGLKEKEIPLSAQIVAIADVYDALTTERAYKPAYSHLHSLQILNDERGKHFSPQILDVFLQITDQFDQIRTQFSEDVTT